MRRSSTSTSVETRLAAPPAGGGITKACIPVNSAISGANLGRFRRALLRWYDEHRRDLPWRESSDPYHIWLSEIMLQQTRVAAVLEHYRSFLERFPNVQALAAASEDAVLAAWSGLGYYRRARMLHRCAQQIVEATRRLFPARFRFPPRPAWHRTLYGRGHRQHRVCPTCRRSRWQCRARVAATDQTKTDQTKNDQSKTDQSKNDPQQNDRQQPDHGANLATCANSSRRVPARRFQSSHDGTRRHRVLAARAPLRAVPGPKMVRDAGSCARGSSERGSELQAPFPPTEKTNLVCAGVAQS